MNPVRKTLFTIVLFSSLCGKASAQNTGAWTLQQCIEYAIKNNIQVRQIQLNSELSKVALSQSKAAILPSLNANASHSYNFGRTIDPFTNTFATDRVLSQNFSLSSNVTLFGGLQTYNTIRQNQMNYLASRFDVVKTTNDISLSIATAYLQILFNEELRNNTQNQLNITLAQVNRTKILFDAGSVAKGTLLDIQSQQAGEELNLINVQNQLDLSYLSLVQLLNIDSVNNFSIIKPILAEPSETILTTNPAQIYSAALTRQPEIKSAEFKVLGSERGLNAAKGGMSPRLILSGAYGTGYSGASQRFVGAPNYTFSPNGNFTSKGDTVYGPLIINEREVTPFNVQVNDNVNKNIGLHLTVPIFNGLQTRSSVSRAKIQVEISRLNLELEKNNLDKAIQQAYADANAAFKKYVATKKALEAMKESFKYTEGRFNVGMLNANDYNDSKSKLTKVESDLLSSKYDYTFKTKVLDFYMGKPLTF